MGRHRNTIGKAGIALLAAGVLASCGAPGSRPSAAQTPENPTIVSLNPCIDAIVVDVAAREQILALSHYSRDAGSSSIDADVAANFSFTGGTAEEVIVLAPDIVLAGSFIAPATKRALERAAIRVETFGSPISIDESLAQIRDLSQVLGREGQGANLIERITDALPEPKAPPENGAVRTLLWQPGQIVPGQTSLVWDIFDRYGVINHGAALGLEQADHASLEMIMANPPDLLLIAGTSSGQLHPSLEALDTTFVARFEPKLFYCGGPSIVAAVERMEEIKTEFMMNPPGAITYDAR